jgi:hypothetical protein
MTEHDNTHRKCNELAHSSVVAHLFSQSCLDTSPMWTAIIKEDVRKLNSVQIKTSWECSNSGFHMILCWYY